MSNVISDLFATHKVVIFSKSFCPYCSKSKSTFQKTGVQVHVVELDKRPDGPGLQEDISKLSGIKTVPQTFLDGKFIGDNSQITKLYDTGKLTEMLKEHNVPAI